MRLEPTAPASQAGTETLQGARLTTAARKSSSKTKSASPKVSALRYLFISLQSSCRSGLRPPSGLIYHNTSKYSRDVWALASDVTGATFMLCLQGALRHGDHPVQFQCHQPSCQQLQLTMPMQGRKREATFRNTQLFYTCVSALRLPKFYEAPHASQWDFY